MLETAYFIQYFSSQKTVLEISLEKNSNPLPRKLFSLWSPQHTSLSEMVWFICSHICLSHWDLSFLGTQTSSLFCFVSAAPLRQCLHMVDTQLCSDNYWISHWNLSVPPSFHGHAERCLLHVLCECWEAGVRLLQLCGVTSVVWCPPSFIKIESLRTYSGPGTDIQVFISHSFSTALCHVTSCALSVTGFHYKSQMNRVGW